VLPVTSMTVIFAKRLLEETVCPLIMAS